MKTTTNFFAVSALVMASAILLAGCQTEPLATAENEAAATEEVIPIYVEGLNGTKMNIDGTDGTCAWQELDQIMMWVGSHLLVPVKDGSVRVSLTGSQTRSKWAAYPGDIGSHNLGGTNPVVNYVYEYNMLGGKNLVSDYCPAPMVADNTKNTLKFYHVGGVLRLHLTSIPSGTKSIQVTLTGKNSIWAGSYTVSNAGTASQTVSGSGSYNRVIFNYLTYNSSMTLNIPLPPGDYSTVSKIEVSCCSLDVYNNGTSYIKGIAPKNVTGLGTVSRAQGIKMSIDFNSIVNNGNTYAPNPYGNKIERGFLKWDADNNCYTFTDGTDPLEMLNYTDPATAKGVYYHKYSDLRAYLSVSKCTYNTPIPIDGVNYYLLGDDYNTEGGYMLGNYYSNAITFNNSKQNYFTMHCLVDLSDAKPENGAARDYRNKGFNNASGSYIADHNGGYVAGVLAFSYNSSVTIPSISNINGAASSNIISFKALKYFTDNGAIFVPALGYISSTWQSRGTNIYIGIGSSSSSYDENYICTALAAGATPYTNANNSTCYYPIMVRKK